MSAGEGPNNWIIQISIYSLKLDFSIVELQMRGISLFSFSKGANECLISEKRVFSHFVPITYVVLRTWFQILLSPKRFFFF